MESKLKVPYTEFQSKTEMVNPIEYYLEFQERGMAHAANQFRKYLDTDEPYLYGRNNVYRNLMYAEESKQQVLTHIMVPKEVWAKANQLFGKLKSYVKST